MNKEQLNEAIQQGRIEVRLKPTRVESAQEWHTPKVTGDVVDVVDDYEWRIKEPAMFAVLYVVYWINRKEEQCFTAFESRTRAKRSMDKLRGTGGNRAITMEDYYFHAVIAQPAPPHIVEEPTYRDLAVGEVIEMGDQFYSLLRKEWVPVISGECDHKVPTTHQHSYRRPLEPAPTEPEVGPGYIMLRADEVIRQGDEVRGKNSRYPTIWSPAGNIGGTPNDFNLKYRRYLGPAMVDPGVGYRILKPGETVGARDEWWEEGFKKWLTTDREGAFVGDHRTYRRAV